VRGRAIPASVKRAVANGGKGAGERPYLIDRWSANFLGSINTRSARPTFEFAHS